MIKHVQDPRTVPAQPGLHIIYGMVIAKTQIGAVVLPSQSQSQSSELRAPSSKLQAPSPSSKLQAQAP
ncbi:MAG: hypothetical protein CMO04_17825, partial [Thalassospira sp.]|nr:hypothetical protein [Thalassospira sp.]